MEFNVKDKVAVITGSSRGLGYTFAQTLVFGGAKTVYINSRKKEACDEAVKNLTKYAQQVKVPTKIFAIPCNLNNTAGVETLVNGVKANGDDKIDILIANAGASWGESLEKHPEEAFQKVIDLNLKGVFLTIQKFLPFLKKDQGLDSSRVIINASVSGLYNSSSATTYGYNASKAGIIHLGKLLAIQLPSKYNINVNTICPGFFPSKMANGLLSILGKEYTEVNPKKRLGKDSDLSPIILFLCDKKTEYLNGLVFPIDGGHHLLGPKL